MARADEKLKASLKAWRKICPEDPTDIEDVGKTQAATDKIERELMTLKVQFRRKADEYEEFSADDVAAHLKEVKAYQKVLREVQSEQTELKKWLAKVRSSPSALPFALVVKGNDKGSLHVFKQENRVDRSAREGKQDITGSKVHNGTCEYTGGKLVFDFEDNARAPWKPLLQKLVNRAGVNMKVALARNSESDEPS
ncbi:hypothetical protein Mal4_55980 [Maioricimonas rarisocia]|uniref:Uncharacterized protein n=1 Tax=Maioricimonas rarisocia TaxID=2528026 RepID=A0A517ZFG3_9PLAN|nr:hypothetical protein [Maioricimonas rarisocia]QDU41233.1 hypothetical protein Mal4_55980 [Maioricimonas rarisocia]